MNIESHIPCVLCHYRYWVPELYTDYVKKNKQEFICGDCCCRDCFNKSLVYYNKYYDAIELAPYKNTLVSIAKKRCRKLTLLKRK